MQIDKLKEKYKKLADYFDRPAWINRALFYTTIFLSIALTFIFIFGIFNLISPSFTFPNNNINYDNERYLLSALVQSLAAVIALVITLSLVAVQLAAQSYSARVIDVYKKNPDMWILLCIYISTIFYGLGLIKVVGLGIFKEYMELLIFVAYFLGFFAFVCLVPYMLKTLDLLKPSTVIELLAVDITKENVLNAIDYEDDSVTEKDPVQPIIDIINGALLRNDYETVRNGLTAIKKSTVSILEKKNIKKDKKIKAAYYILQRVKRFGIMAACRKNEDSTISAIRKLGQIGTKAAEEKRQEVATETTKEIGNIGIKAAEKKLEEAAKEAAKEIGNVGTKAAEERLEGAAKEAVNTIINIGIKATEKKQKTVATEVATALGNIGTKAAEEELQIVAKEAAKEIGNVETKAAEKGLEEVAIEAEKALRNIGTKAAEKGLHKVVREAAKEIGNVGTKAAEKKLEEAAKEAAKEIGNVGTKATEKKLQNDARKAIKDAAEALLKKAEENQWSHIAEIIANDLQKIEQICNQSKNKDN